MSSCCNGPQKRKVKEWGTVDKKNNNGSKKYILLITLIVIGAIGFIVLR